MSANWDYYRRRRRITDLSSWRDQNNIETYTDFLKVLRSLSLDPVPPTHPDLVLMEITGGDEARKMLEERRERQKELDLEISNAGQKDQSREKPDPPDILDEPVVEKPDPPDILDEPVVEKTVYTKSRLQQMKKSELQNLCKDLGVELGAEKQTKSSIISAIMGSQK